MPRWGVMGGHIQGMGKGDDQSRVLREIAESCKQQQWSVAIRLLTSLPTLSSSAILFCNRALCYSKLELYKHIVKDCDMALALSPCTLQAYLYKGQALAAMGKHQESVEVWRKGYEICAGQPTDLQLLLQLHSLVTQESLSSEKENTSSETVATNPSKDTGKNQPVEKPSGNCGTLSFAAITDKEEKLQEKKETSQGHVRRLSVELRLARGISEVNSGKYEKAVDIFTQLIKDDLGSTSALIGRGTAYAFQRKLDLAIADFSKAIELDPTALEAWKRRGQARAAIAPSLDAISDLSEALKLDGKSPETLNERGVVYYKLKDYLSAVDDLRACVALDSSNKYAYNYLGLALTAAGEYVDGLAAHYKALELDSSFKEAWTHLAQSYKELADSAKAMECLRKVLTLDAKYIHAYRLMGLLLLSLGDHRGAIKELTIGLEMDPSNKDCHYLRGSCFHAIGNYKDAVKDYDAVIDAEVQTIENRIVQSLSFYQREIALYSAMRTNMPFNYFNLDGDLEPVFKEAWCKRLSPVALFPSYARQPQLKDPVIARSSKIDDLALTKAKKTLIEAADRLGQLIQYNCPGFLRNVRQHRMAGLAAIEIAQRVANYLRVLREAKKVQEMSIMEKEQKPRDESMEEISHNRGGVCSSSNAFSPPCSCHEEALLNQGLSWRDVYTIAVKWRQISEPCDPVVWVDKLSEKEFAAGFGSHTPMLLGQSKIVRYYSNFPRAFGVAKKIILEERQVFNAANKPVDLSDPMQLLAIDSAATCKEVYDVVGQDFWIVTPCHSTASSGKVLDGTRLTLQKLGLNSYDFSIRTPGTPQRWAEYDREMTAAWEEYCKLYCGRSKASNKSKQMKQLQECILRLSYYWYNFMPLARGTAVVGYVTLLGLFLAAEMEVSASIPEGVQVDWEAILSPDLQTFMQSVRPWLLPSLSRDTSWQSLPNVSETFSTLSSVVGVLSSHY
ncbi:hypothetical protein R1flu_020189 [Riccia fluitans]|uniref:Suppressor of RPS4-RLD 1 n=1 Tax=Riccia fluitans TaxID=41844 RepID=A0ABD1ZMH5_9MARC